MLQKRGVTRKRRCQTERLPKKEWQGGGQTVCVSVVTFEKTYVHACLDFLTL